MRKICEMCYDIIRIEYKVHDSVLYLSLPRHLQKNNVCLSCFTKLADEAQIDWSDIQFTPIPLVETFLE